MDYRGLFYLMRPLDSWFMDTYPWDKDAIAKIKNKEFSLIWALRLSKIPIANPLGILLYQITNQPISNNYSKNLASETTLPKITPMLRNLKLDGLDH